MDGLAILRQLVNHLQTGDVPDSTNVNQRHREGSSQRGRPVRDWKRLVQSESQPQAGALLHLRVDIIYEEPVELVQEFGVELGRWSVGTERVVAASEGRGAVTVEGIGSVRAQSNRILLI